MTFLSDTGVAETIPPPLEGVLVVEATANIAGPSAGMILADLGASVIRIEPPEGDATRRWPPFADGVSTVYMAFNRGKQVRFIDLKTGSGVEEAHDLIKTADVFIESFRPGKAADLGLGWEELHDLNKRLIYASINGYGSVGPKAGEPGFDAVVQAYSGMMDLTGHPGEPPARVGVAALDVGVGMWTVIDVLAAIRQRDTTGCGVRLESTLLGTAAAFMVHHLAAARHAGASPSRLGSAQHNFAPYQSLATRDGSVMIGVNSDRLWQRLCVALGAPRLAADPRFAANADRVARREELVESIEEYSTRRTSAELTVTLSGAGIPNSPVRTVTDLVADPQLEALELWGTSSDGIALLRAPVGPVRDSLGPGLRTLP